MGAKQQKVAHTQFIGQSAKDVRSRGMESGSLARAQCHLDSPFRYFSSLSSLFLSLFFLPSLHYIL